MTNPSAFSGAWKKFRSPAAAAPETQHTPEESPRCAPEASAAQPEAAQAQTASRETARPGAQAAPAQDARQSMADRCFNALSYIAVIALPLLLMGQFHPKLSALAPWLLPQEADFANAYDLAKAAGQWLVPSASAPPAWFWLARLANAIPYVDGPLAFTAAALLSGVVTLLGCLFLTNSAGWSRRAAFASGLVLLSSLYFPFAAHRVGPELLGAGLLVLASGCLCRGWSKEQSFLWLASGGVFSAAAGLTVGLPGLLLPIITSFLFLAGRGKFRRLNRPDGALGFGLLLLLPLLWLGAAMLFAGEAAPLRPLISTLVAPLFPPYWPPKEPAWFFVLVLPLALFPWILALPFAAVRKPGPKPLLRTAADDRARSGTGWIALNLLIGLLLLSGASAKHCPDVILIMPFAALLLGKLIDGLAPAGSRAFFQLVAALFLIAALALGLLALMQIWPAIQGFIRLPKPELFAALGGLPILAGICLVAAAVLWKLPDRGFPSACLLICVIFTTALSQAALWRTVPGMQDTFAGKAAPAPTLKATPAAPKTPAAAPKPTEPAKATPETPASKPTEAAAPPKADAPADAKPAAPADTPKTPASETPAPETEKAAPKAPDAPAAPAASEKKAETPAPAPAPEKPQDGTPKP